jgi:diguanylate cyclase (GGDEF)-like protein
VAEPTAPEGDSAERLQRRLARERAARVEAETIAERATRELYDTVQQLTRSSRLSELLGEIAVHANEAATVDEAMAAALASVCDYAGWAVGHALVRSSEDPDALVSLGIWQLPQGEEGCFAGFRAASEELRFPLGRGLPGRALDSGEPAWIADLSSDANFPRAEAAAACGLVSAFALPVLIRTETTAVLEFFAAAHQEPDATLLRVARFVGAQLGRVLERQVAEERLSRLALYDGLTGLPNRMLLMDRLQTTLRRARRAGSRVDLLYLDVDDFKTINDSRGHAAGDGVLVALAERLQHAVRAGDTVGLAAPYTVARLGGDEFAIVLEDCADPAVVARRIEEVLRTPLQLEDGEVFVSLSIGTALADDDLPAEAGGEQLLGRANVAMHEAKRAGKGNYQVFQPQFHEQAHRRHVLGEELHRAVVAQEFVVAYQPVVRLVDDAIVGAEALVRWRHPTQGWVQPLEFIPRAEETGLIVPIGRWVLQESCRQAVLWQQLLPDFSIAVNVSGRQLREDDFVETVREALELTGLAPGSLCLEMTESILMERDEAGIAALATLRADGVHLAIDDFGTGYSSLGALRGLPADLLKIDRSFISSLPEDDDAGTIAWAVVRLGHTLGMQVLAEGVETQAQRDALRRFGCDEAQGWLFGRPVPAEELEQQLRAGSERTG